jgi:hypothetical protein
VYYGAFAEGSRRLGPHLADLEGESEEKRGILVSHLLCYITDASVSVRVSTETSTCLSHQTVAPPDILRGNPRPTLRYPT